MSELCLGQTENKFENSIINLEDLASTHISQIYDIIPLGAGDEAVCLESSLNFFFNLWHWRNERWRAVRQKVQIGLITESKNLGNTSICMGIANEYAKNNTFLEDIRIEKKNILDFSFLCCDSHSIKYQHYQYDFSKNLLYFKGEYESKNRTSVLVFITGKSDKEINTTASVIKDELIIYLNQENLPFNTKIYAFLTGKFRDRWESQLYTALKDLMAKELEKGFRIVSELFKDVSEDVSINKLGDSYFISQEQESIYTFNGINTFYNNLMQFKEIKEEYSLLSVFNVEKENSCFIFKAYDSPVILIHDSNIDDLSRLSQNLMQQLNEPLAMNLFLKNIEESEKPLIAIKSGMTLLLEGKKVSISKFLLKEEKRKKFSSNLEDLTNNNEEINKNKPLYWKVKNLFHQFL